MLLKHAFHSPSSETSRAAMRALANAMFLKPNTRQIFIDQGFATNACDGLGSGDWDDEFLRSRIVFLSTYGTNVDLSDLIKNHQLAKSIVDNLGKHAKKVSGKKDNVVQSEPMEDMALAETLKLLFNVTHYCREEWGSFTPALPHIITLFWRQDIPEKKPLDSPFGPLVNSLVNFDFDTESAKAVIFPKGQQSKICDRMIELLDKAMKDYRGNDLDGTVTPLVGVMTKLYENAPEEARETMRQNLLPSAADRVSVLGEGDTLSGRLLKNSTNPLAPALRTAISHLQFDLSDRNATKFVENVGYGFASGFLFQNNVPIPTSASEAFSTTDTTGNVRSVNPITGQFWDKEKHPELPEMTDEEKEREAERLFVLFERYVSAVNETFRVLIFRSSTG